MTRKLLSELVPFRRQGPVSLIMDPAVYEALDAHPDLPPADMSDSGFQAYVTARLGYVMNCWTVWEMVPMYIRGRVADCWELYQEKIGNPAAVSEPIPALVSLSAPERESTEGHQARKSFLLSTIFSK